MIDLEYFLIGLMAVSAFTSLVTEAIKKIFTEHNKTYHSNTVAGIVAAILSAALGVGYVIYTGIGFSAQIIICIIGLIFMGWLCSMVGYDKVISQFKSTKKE